MDRRTTRPYVRTGGLLTERTAKVNFWLELMHKINTFYKTELIREPVSWERNQSRLDLRDQNIHVSALRVLINQRREQLRFREGRNIHRQTGWRVRRRLKKNWWVVFFLNASLSVCVRTGHVRTSCFLLRPERSWVYEPPGLVFLMFNVLNPPKKIKKYKIKKRRTKKHTIIK